MIRRALLLVTLSFIVSLRAGQAQVVVQVTDPDGRPLSGVQADIWGPGQLLASFVTDPHGRVEFPATVVHRSRRVSFTHLGYDPRIIDSKSLDQLAEVSLSTRPVEIEGITVDLDRSRTCSRVDDPEARGLWASAASNYASDTGRRGGALDFFIDSGDVREAELFHTDENHMQRGQEEWTGSTWPPTPGKFQLLEEVVKRDGYAWKGRSSRRRHYAWNYPQLDGRQAYHFATDVFGELHRLTLLSRTDDGILIRFCPGDTNPGPKMVGTIQISYALEFLRATWRFLTPTQEEGAGGEVIFAPPTETPGGQHLQAARGIFFRHDGKDPLYPDLPRDYYREVRVFSRWIISPDGNLPAGGEPQG